MTPSSSNAAPLVVAMGVTGCGKSTAGAALAAHVGVRFADGDDYHTPENVAKMASGTPLTDQDRWPWLYTLAGYIAGNADRGVVVACSALKRSYRDVLRTHAPGLVFLHLHAEPEVMVRRVANRPGHFMPTSLVDSQFATLEMLGDDEGGAEIYADDPVDTIVANFLKAFPGMDPSARA